MRYTKLIEFSNDYCETYDADEKTDDSICKIFIDGFPENEHEEGEVVAIVSITKSEDIVIDFHNNAYRENEYVKGLIESAKQALKKYYKEVMK